MVANGIVRSMPIHGMSAGFPDAVHSDFQPLTRVNGVNSNDTNLLLICSSHYCFSLMRTLLQALSRAIWG